MDQLVKIFSSMLDNSEKEKILHPYLFRLNVILAIDSCNGMNHNDILEALQDIKLYIQLYERQVLKHQREHAKDH